MVQFGLGDSADEDTEEIDGGLGIVGSYRLTDILGEGGMGIVYRAVQTEPFRREVAVKVLKSGMDTREVIRRFEAEQQALALMDHPSIAKVFDAGETDRGNSFFAMERVEGQSLTEYCDVRKLGIRDRLDIFVKVCRAVLHAHQKGVIHRDLKPSNILVGEDDDGETLVKVIDFGIAKAIGDDWADRTMMTWDGQILGTPQYMSPEQAGVGAIDTRTDIYALGVILYELLTGSTPIQKFLAARAPIDELIAEIKEGSVERPSSRLEALEPAEAEVNAENRGESSADRLFRRIEGDLDWITLKCLEKEPVRRYSSVGDLAEDIEHFLSDEPVDARPPSKLYSLGKFARRNKAFVAAGGAVLLILIVATVVSVRWAIEADKSRRLAETRLKQGDAVPQFLINSFRKVDPTSGDSDLLAVDVLDQAVQEATEEFSAQPVMLARILEALAKTYQGLGYYDKATNVSAKAKESVQSVETGDRDLYSRLLVLDSETSRLESRQEDALAASLQNIEVQSREFGADSFEAVNAKWEHVRNLLASSMTDEAERLLKSTEATSKRFGENGVDGYLDLLGAVRSQQRRFDEAIPLLRRRLVENANDYTDYRSELMWKVWHLTTALWSDGQVAEAVAWSELLVRCTEKIYGAERIRTAKSVEVVAACYQEVNATDAIWLLCSIAILEGEREGLQDEALEMLKELRGESERKDGPFTNWKPSEENLRPERIEPELMSKLSSSSQPEIWVVLSDYWKRCGLVENAIDAAEKAYGGSRATLEPTDPRLVMRGIRYASLLLEGNHWERAESVLLEMPNVKTLASPLDRVLCEVWDTAIESLDGAGEVERARSLDRKLLLPELLSLATPDGSTTNKVYYRITNYLRTSGEDGEVRNFYEETVDRLHEKNGEWLDVAAPFWCNLASANVFQKRCDEAIAVLDELDLWLQKYGNENTYFPYVRIWSTRGFALDERGDFAEADICFQKALAYLQDWKGENRLEDKNWIRDQERYVAQDCAKHYRKWGKEELKVQWEFKAAFLALPESKTEMLQDAYEAGDFVLTADLVCHLISDEDLNMGEVIAMARFSQSLATQLAEGGDYQAAEQVMWKAIDMSLAWPDPPLGVVMDCYTVLSRVRTPPRNATTNADFHAIVAGKFEKAFGPGHHATRNMRLRQSEILLNAKRYDEAGELIQSQLAEAETGPPPELNWEIAMRVLYGRVQMAEKKYPDAEASLNLVWEFFESTREGMTEAQRIGNRNRIGKSFCSLYETMGDESKRVHWLEVVGDGGKPAQQ